MNKWGRRYRPGKSRKKFTSSEYGIWKGMRKRCNTPNNKAYEYYGGRGIKVCKRWDKFENFLLDMGKRPSKGHTLDRINNNKGYSKTNCRWATWRVQGLNKRKPGVLGALLNLTSRKSRLGLRGVFKMPYGGYRATVKGKCLGFWGCKWEAAEAYNKEAKRLYGKNACLNVIGSRK